MTLTGKHIILAFLFLANALVAFAQNEGSLSGVVTDQEDKLPIIGASVTIVGTYKAAVTDIDGNYDQGNQTWRLLH